MASGIDRLAQQIAGLLKKDSPSGYDTTATVIRVEGGTAWVHIPGGVDETPVRMTVNANVGDSVQVRVGGGRAFIIGNGTAPPTDDTRANYAAFAAKRAQSAADKAEEDAIYAAARAAEANGRAQAAQDIATATSQHFWTDDGGVHVSSETDNATATRNTLWNSLGMLFRKGANILLAITTGTNPSIDFYDGAGNAGSNILASFGSAGIRIGTANATQIVLDSTNGLRLGSKIALDTSGNASFTGTITSTAGNIGGWDLESTAIAKVTSDGNYRVRIQAPASPTSGNYALRIDQKSGSDWTNKLALTYGGRLIANDASIRGDIKSIGQSADAEISDGVIATEDKNGNWLAYMSGANLFINDTQYTGSQITYNGSGTAPRFGIRNFSGLDVTGSIFGSSALGTGGKTAWNDTSHAGTWITSNGAIHMTQDATHGGGIGFHYNFSANATSTISENASGVLTVSGDLTVNQQLQGKTYNGYVRNIVGSQIDDGQRVGMIRYTSANGGGIACQNGTAGSTYAWRNWSVSSSDIRLKKNVEDCEVEDALSVINQIRMHSFDWLHTEEHQRIGFIADELEQIDPKLSMGGGTERDGTINYKSVDTFYLLGYLTKAVQELSTEVERLRRELNGNHSES